MTPVASRTPESLLSGLQRRDSKNPLTTCHGTTAAGRPCRRSLAAAVSALSAVDSCGDEESSVVAVVEDREYGSEVTAFFCWQHKDQADAYHAGKARKVQLTNRGSLEDMMSSMGLQDAQDIRTVFKRPPRRKQMREDKALAGFPSQPAFSEKAVQRADLSSHESMQDHDRLKIFHDKRNYERRRRRPQQQSVWEIFCGCHKSDAGDFEQQSPKALVRSYEPESQTARLPTIGSHGSQPRFGLTSPGHTVPSRSTPQLPTTSPRPAPHQSYSQPVVLHRPCPGPPDIPRTSEAAREISPALSAGNTTPVDQALSVIPKEASIQLASSLMAEMSKVGQDRREGFIYMYWLDEAQQPHHDDDGESLLEVAPRNFPATRAGATGSSRILLKIGRAENVHRRLSQWQLQCGYKPLLVRSYPKAGTREKVRHLHRVERLIHTELWELNVKRPCKPCAKEHREWFEVDGRDGVRAVDRIIEKWIAWSARQRDI